MIDDGEEPMRINLLKLFSVDDSPLTGEVPLQMHVYFSITRSDLLFFAVHLNKYK